MRQQAPPFLALYIGHLSLPIVHLSICHCQLYIVNCPFLARWRGLYAGCVRSQAGEQGRDDGYDELTDGLDGSFRAFFPGC